MPKMKVLETRQTTEQIILMSWSPRMDLLAVLNSKSDISLHRLSWQKIWTLPSDHKIGDSGSSFGTPSFFSWHPEGLILAVGFENVVLLVDVESGQASHYHDVVGLCTGQWRSTQYEPPLKDLMARSKHENLQPQSEYKTSRVESHLSVLILGTSQGSLYFYISGILLALLVHLDSPYPCSIVQSELSPDIQSFQILTINRIHEYGGNVLSLVHLENELIPNVADILGSFGFKIEFMRHLWKSITDEMSSMNETWGKIVDIYTHYLTYGTGKESENVRADYMELLICGTGSIEMEIFLGSGGREKEAKKFGVAVHSAKMCINTNLKNIKRSIIFMLVELNEVEGFYELISEKSEAARAVRDLARTYTYLYLACLQFQQISDNFVKIFFNFMTLLLVTIHTYHVMESHPDPLDDDSDPDKVLELLRYPVKKDMYDMILAHDKTEGQTIPTVHTVAEYPEMKTVVDLRSKTAVEDLDWIPFWRHVLENESIQWNEGVFGLSKTELHKLLKNFSTSASEKLTALYKIPLLKSDVHRSTYVLNCFEGNDLGKFGMLFDPATRLNLVYHQEEGQFDKLWLYSVDLWARRGGPAVTTSYLSFSRPVQNLDFFSPKYVTILSYDAGDKRGEQQESGRSIVCQLSIKHIREEGLLRRLKICRTTVLEDKKWNNVHVTVPTNVYMPGPIADPFVDHILPIVDFCPALLVVSGPRKVGSILGENRKTVLLLEIDLEKKNNNTTTLEGESTANLSESE